METLRGARTYDELTVAKAITYEAFVSPMQAMGQASVTPSVRQGVRTTMVGDRPHGLAFI